MPPFISARLVRAAEKTVFAGLIVATSVFAANTATAQPAAPVPISPNGPTTDANPNYVWYAAAGATQYFVQVGDGLAITAQGLFGTEICSGGTCAVNLAHNLSAGVNYWWAVQAKNGPGGTWSVNLNFTVQAPPAPTLLAPNGATSNPNPNYTWNASSGATDYFVQVGDGVSIVAQGLFTSAQVCSTSPCAVNLAHNLSAGVNYWWAVQAKNAAGGTWSANMNFTVQAPPAPTLVAPNGAIGNPNPTYTWNSSSGATQYYLQVGDFTNIVFSRTYDTSVCSGATCVSNTTPALPIGSYWWGIQAQNVAGGGTWSTMNFQVQAPPAPTLTSPSGGVATPTPTFTWTASSGPTAATSYLLQLMNGTTTVYQLTYSPAQASCGTSCSVTPTTALTAGTYTWSVKAMNAAGSTWSSSLSFTYGSAPAPPTLVSPNGPMTSVTPTFRWNVSVGATEYFIHVLDLKNNLPKFQSTLSASQYCSGGQCSIAPGVTLAAGDYEWWVQAKNTAGTAWSDGALFTVAGCSGEVKTGDFNGDGRTDRLCAGPSSILVSLATGTGFTTGTAWLSPGFGNLLVADFNSDGLTDIAKYDSTTAVYSVALSTGTSFGALQPWGTANTPQIPQACAGISAKADVGDFNGDGRPDVSCKLSGSPSVFVGLSNGSSFTFSTFGSAFCETGERTGVIDVNGDGKSDWYCLGPTNEALLVFPSTGTGFGPAISASDSSFCDDTDVFFGDFNGDGKTDVSCKANGRVRVSTGSSFLDIGGLGGGWCTSSAQGRWPYAFGADLDGDGVAEMVCIGAGDAGANLNVRKWLGTTLGPSQTWAGGFCFGAINVGDFDGDGKTDVLCEDTGAWGSPGTSGTRADLLSQVDNGMGGSTTITYVPSTSFTNNPGVGSRQVARTVTTSDGRTAPSTTTYTYANGKVDPLEHMFLGFQSFRVDPPCLSESGCPYVVTVSSQTVASAGKPLDVRHVDPDGFLATMQTYQYTESVSPTLPRTSLLNRTDSYLSGRDFSFLHTYTTYPAYDAYGNLTQTVSYGDATKAGDDLETDTTFVPKIDNVANPNIYIVGLPAQVQRKVPGGAALQTEQYEYDGTGVYPAVANWNVAPTKGNLTAVSRYLNQPTSKTVTRRMTYNTVGSVLTATDETGRPTTTTYETATGYSLFPKNVTNPATETTIFTWDNSCAAIKTSKDPNSQTTSQTYDPLCRASLTTDPLTGSVQRTYLDLGDPNLQRTRIETTQAFGVTGLDWSEAYFDGLGRTYKTTKRGPADDQDIVTEQTFNTRGGVAASTEAYYVGDGPQRTTSFQYDTQDRQTKTILPDQNEINTSYGAQSQTVTDPNGKATTTRFDAYGRVVAVERMFNGSLATTTTTYDTPLGLVKTMTDAVGSPWTWKYDSLGRQYYELDPDAGLWTYEYDDAGRPTKQTDAKNQVTTMTYNTGGRLATKVTPVGTTTYTYTEPRTGYFNAGRLTTLTSPADTLKLDYDKLGRNAKQQRIFGGTTYTVTKAWDIGGYLQSTTYPDNDVIGSLGYDEAGRLKTIPGIIEEITYDAAGRPLSRANANSTSTAWSYTPERGFLDNIYTASSSGNPLQDLSYTYDPAGLVQSVTSPFPDEGWTTYNYDDFYHLAQATNTSSSANSQTFTYDKVDRITNNSRTGVVLNYTYPANGSATRPHAPTAVNGAGRTYDANGNLLTGSGQTLTWNGENRLATAVVGSTTTTFTYDSFGERLKKASGSNTSIYPFGDDYEVTNGTITKYISVEGLGVVAKKVGLTTTSWIQTDALGSINVETDSSGSFPPALRRRYRPYGETLTSTGSLTESRGWIDQRNDTETTLTYLHARYFDPKLGQFLSPDPIGVRGGLNAFAYGLGNPITFTDRSGLCPADVPVSAEAGLARTGGMAAGPAAGPAAEAGATAAASEIGKGIPVPGKIAAQVYEGLAGRLAHPELVRFLSNAPTIELSRLLGLVSKYLGPAALVVGALSESGCQPSPAARARMAEEAAASKQPSPNPKPSPAPETPEQPSPETSPGGGPGGERPGSRTPDSERGMPGMFPTDQERPAGTPAGGHWAYEGGGRYYCWGSVSTQQCVQAF